MSEAPPSPAPHADRGPAKQWTQHRGEPRPNLQHCISQIGWGNRSIDNTVTSSFCNPDVEGGGGLILSSQQLRQLGDTHRNPSRLIFADEETSGAEKAQDLGTCRHARPATKFDDDLLDAASELMAHEARDASVREHYAKLGQIWLECAARTKLRSDATTRPEPIIQTAA